MKLSVIMRTKNADWVVEQALRALHSQTVRHFELVVIDSGSTDRTLDIVNQFTPRLLRIPPSAYIPGAVLNRAIEVARGDILVFQNSDTVPLNPFALERLVGALDEPRVVASFARQIPRPEAATWVRRDYEVSFPAEGDAPPWMPLSLPFAAMRRSAWRKHPFHTAAFGSEDIEWGMWARKNGHLVRYVPNSVVMHSHNYTLREAFGRRFIEGEADAFINGDTDSLAQAAWRTVGGVARDIAYHAARGDWKGLCESPVRRAAFHFGYYRGHRHGERRRAGAGGDASLGQRVVLERFGGSGAREDR
ncbi:MAG: glycosyltransferase [Polyangiaceae bacterium]|nr:glycosyltransferase [Polyangiaceae bacterium]